MIRYGVFVMVVFYICPAKPQSKWLFFIFALTKPQGRLHGHSCALARMDKSRSHKDALNFSKRLVGSGNLNPRFNWALDHVLQVKECYHPPAPTRHMLPEMEHDNSDRLMRLLRSLTKGFGEPHRLIPKPRGSGVSWTSGTRSPVGVEHRGHRIAWRSTSTQCWRNSATASWKSQSSTQPSHSHCHSTAGTTCYIHRWKLSQAPIRNVDGFPVEFMTLIIAGAAHAVNKLDLFPAQHASGRGRHKTFHIFSRMNLGMNSTFSTWGGWILISCLLSPRSFTSTCVWFFVQQYQSNLPQIGRNGSQPIGWFIHPLWEFPPQKRGHHFPSTPWSTNGKRPSFWRKVMESDSINQNAMTSLWLLRSQAFGTAWVGSMNGDVSYIAVVAGWIEPQLIL